MKTDHPFVRPFACLGFALASLAIPCCSPAFAQNLYTNPNTAPLVFPPQAPPSGDQPGQQSPQQPTPAYPPDASTAPITSPAIVPTAQSPRNEANPAAAQLEGVSLFVVVPPAPPKFSKHDLVEIIVNESSVQKFSQKSDLKKDYDLSAELKKFPSLAALITDLELREGIGSPTPQLGVSSKNKFKGEGKLDRTDQVTAKLTAVVVDVKPNGNLVLEARESIQSDREIKTMVLAGTCRAQDITRNNTIQSSQLAGLTIKIEQEGDVKDASEKGLIPRVLESIFNF